eukprot:CAMPEP_0184859672 /NCGR_PEP_ID=MMETSP0580-20130426/4665_1 /TAXON_ID=1118495 /ORGANISM="Dactyliosolen fragilissimus" /LENGTH=363 /DNA_ID=CAMNT_0027356453 /DNA_START=69 /DNA_END=1160 /DNA_ORIENTATION=-
MRMNHHLRTIRQLFLTLISFILLLQAPFTSSIVTPESYIQKTPVVICPGFGNDQIDYIEPLKQPREKGFLAALERRGFDPSLLSIVPIQRRDWLRVAGGLTDWNFYTGNALPTGASYGWYIQRLKQTVDEAYENSGGQRVLLIGHSAGGWLARAALGDGIWCTERNLRSSDRVKCLTTLGSIHRVPTDPSTCVTRGALRYTDQNYPGSFLNSEGIQYVSVGGKAIEGSTSTTITTTTDNPDMFTTPSSNNDASKVAYASYEAVAGYGNAIGDGVVPLDWTQLEESTQIILDDVVHSINEAGTTIPTDRWYGSEQVIDRWLPQVMQQASIVSPVDTSSSTNSNSGLLSNWISGFISNNFTSSNK